MTPPITFLSSTSMQENLVPGWVHSIARVNPVNWAVEAGRSATSVNTDWSLVGSRIGLLALLLLLCGTLATKAFRTYPAIDLAAR